MLYICLHHLDMVHSEIAGLSAHIFIGLGRTGFQAQSCLYMGPRTTNVEIFPFGRGQVSADRSRPPALGYINTNSFSFSLPSYPHHLLPRLLLQSDSPAVEMSTRRDEHLPSPLIRFHRRGDYRYLSSPQGLYPCFGVLENVHGDVDTA